jgi:aerobic carbon-monoxide dehydrogenase medium subunit
MKPPRFEYAAPTSLEEALQALAEHGDEATVLAGGQSLIPMLNLRLAAPRLLVDIMRVPELGAIRRTGAGIEIGAGVTMARAEREAEQPLLQRALRHVAHPAIRNAGTVCGSVAHADPAAELPAVLLALDGEVLLASSRGSRVLSASEFFRGFLTTAREADELVVGVRLPDAERRTAFIEVTPRLAGSAGEFATAAVAASARVDGGGRLADLRLALAGVGDRPLRARAAEQLAEREQQDVAAFAAAGELAARSLDPPSDVHASAGHRRRLAGALVARALGELAEAAR